MQASSTQSRLRALALDYANERIDRKSYLRARSQFLDALGASSPSHRPPTEQPKEGEQAIVPAGSRRIGNGILIAAAVGVTLMIGIGVTIMQFVGGSAPEFSAQSSINSGRMPAPNPDAEARQRAVSERARQQASMPPTETETATSIPEGEGPAADTLAFAAPDPAALQAQASDTINSFLAGANWGPAGAFARADLVEQWQRLDQAARIVVMGRHSYKRLEREYLVVLDAERVAGKTDADIAPLLAFGEALGLQAPSNAVVTDTPPMGPEQTTRESETTQAETTQTGTTETESATEMIAAASEPPALAPVTDAPMQQGADASSAEVADLVTVIASGEADAGASIETSSIASESPSPESQPIVDAAAGDAEIEPRGSVSPDSEQVSDISASPTAATDEHEAPPPPSAASSLQENRESQPDDETAEPVSEPPPGADAEQSGEPPDRASAAATEPDVEPRQSSVGEDTLEAILSQLAATSAVESGTDSRPHPEPVPKTAQAPATTSDAVQQGIEPLSSRLKRRSANDSCARAAFGANGPTYTCKDTFKDSKNSSGPGLLRVVPGYVPFALTDQQYSATTLSRWCKARPKQCINEKGLIPTTLEGLAAAYAGYLSLRTGKRYRPATDSELRQAAGYGVGPPRSQRSAISFVREIALPTKQQEANAFELWWREHHKPER